jgi:hypothetical protein
MKEIYKEENLESRGKEQKKKTKRGKTKNNNKNRSTPE